MLGKIHPLKLPRKILSYRCPHQGRTAFWLTKIAELWPIPEERRQICHMVCNGAHQQQILDSKFGGQKMIFKKMEDPWHCWYSSWAPTREANNCLQRENVVPVFHFAVLPNQSYPTVGSQTLKWKMFFRKKTSFVEFGKDRDATAVWFLIQQWQRDRSSSNSHNFPGYLHVE